METFKLLKSEQKTLATTHTINRKKFIEGVQKFLDAAFTKQDRRYFYPISQCNTFVSDAIQAGRKTGKGCTNGDAGKASSLASAGGYLIF